MSETAFDRWAAYYRRSAADSSELSWPTETLVRLLRGTYIPGLNRDYAGQKLLDVGTGHGNNLPFLASLGADIAVTEVTEDLCAFLKERAAALGLPIDVRVGLNRSLPFADDTFDLLTSWNVVHYEDNEADIRAAFAEYARVLKPGGRVLLSTTGPRHKILSGAESVGPHRYRIGREDDFRKGEIYYYFDTPEHLQDCMTPAFAEIQVGRTTEELFSETLDYFVTTAVKGA